jgi:hypothetical protein
MALTFRSSTPEKFELVGTDPAGRRRVVTATKTPGAFNWDLRLQHPSGRNWQATYHGAGVLDAMGELMNSKNAEFLQDKARGDRPHEERFDDNRSIVDGDIPPITPISRRY